ncbi:MAG: hypothetical protein ACI90V_011416, partial [Bacillariaceae sp.]
SLPVSVQSTAKMFANIFRFPFVNTKYQMVDNQNPDDGVSLVNILR